MSQCLYVSFEGKNAKKLVQAVQKKARELSLEGTAQTQTERKVLIMICGTKENMNDFVDLLHKEMAKKTIENLQIEPFLKTRDYRGVFRVIE
jgi:acylphosphatase